MDGVQSTQNRKSCVHSIRRLAWVKAWEPSSSPPRRKEIRLAMGHQWNQLTVDALVAFSKPQSQASSLATTARATQNPPRHLVRHLRLQRYTRCRNNSHFQNSEGTKNPLTVLAFPRRQFFAQLLHLMYYLSGQCKALYCMAIHSTASPLPRPERQSVSAAE